MKEKLKKYILYHYTYKHYAYTILGLNSAMRVGDLVSLQWDQILNRNGIFYEHIQQFLEQKTSKRRKTYINDTVKDVLMHLRKLYPHDVFVFQSESLRVKRRPQPWSSKYPITFLKEAAQQINLPYNIGTHSLRKTFAYHAVVTERIPLTKVQVLLNHSNPETTLRYVALDDKEIDAVYRQMAL